VQIPQPKLPSALAVAVCVSQSVYNVAVKRILPKPGQESVWDYPRPPRLETCSKHILIVSNGRVLAETHHGLRLLETSHPPSYYLAPQDVKLEWLTPSPSSSFCEFKGEAVYHHLKSGAKNVAWSYPNPTQGYTALQNFLAFYPGRIVLQNGDGCFVDGERVVPQAGNFYGGWITANVVGPFKGEAGTQGW
jgi:uncharacterized protein (DUF427 family)